MRRVNSPLEAWVTLTSSGGSDLGAVDAAVPCPQPHKRRSASMIPPSEQISDGLIGSLIMVCPSDCDRPKAGGRYHGCRWDRVMRCDDGCVLARSQRPRARPAT